MSNVVWLIVYYTVLAVLPFRPPLCQWTKYKYTMSPLTGGSSLSGSQRDLQLDLHSVEAQQMQNFTFPSMFFFYVTF